MSASKENLNDYNEAYHETFRFNDENTWLLRRYAEHISHQTRLNNAETILSLGIGYHVVSDILSNELLHSVKEYVILEGSEMIIRTFKIKEEFSGKISVIHTYFEEYTTNKKFDIIEVGFVLEHVDNPQLLLDTFKKYLSETGSMFVAVPNARSLHRQIGYGAGLINDLYELGPYDLQLGHKRYFDKESLSEMVEKAGLKIKSTKGLLLKPITTQQINQLGWDKNIVDALLKLGDNYPDISNGIMIEATL